MKKRGRPIGSQVRQNLIEIVGVKGKAHGYELYKDYIAIYPKVTMRLIYYHLKRGCALAEFKVDKIEHSGQYSWGESAQRLIYSLGPSAKPRRDPKVVEHFK